MWLRRARSNARIHPTNFSCSSFKDIHTLFSDDFNSDNLKKPSSVYHRVYRVNSVIRALSLPEPKSQNDSAPFDDSSSSPRAVLSSFPEEETQSEPLISLPGSEERIVVYITSLRVVRSTFEECKAVRSILRGLRVLIDERDVSMDSSFMKELHRILGKCEKTKLTLPRVFIGGRYIGGADEIRRLNETGELKKYVEDLAPAKTGTCEACEGWGFILCGECSGSHRCYSDKVGFMSCNYCNENGLTRCPTCSGGNNLILN